jgi:uncharacterized protein YcfL
MKKTLCSIALALLTACSNESTEHCVTPQSVNAEPLSSFKNNSAEIAAIKSELAKQQENPADFYLELKPNQYGYSVYLWHKDSFLAENCETAENPDKLNRKYIIENGELISPIWWQ